MSNRWFYITAEGQKKGPVDLQTLKSMLSNGLISPGSHVWSPELSGWVLANTLEELRRDAMSDPPPLLEPPNLSIRPTTKGPMPAVRKRSPNPGLQIFIIVMAIPVVVGILAAVVLALPEPTHTSGSSIADSQVGDSQFKDHTISCLAERNGIFKDQITRLDVVIKNQRGAVVQAQININGQLGFAQLCFTTRNGSFIDQEYYVITNSEHAYTSNDAHAMAKTDGIED